MSRVAEILQNFLTMGVTWRTLLLITKRVDFRETARGGSHRGHPPENSIPHPRAALAFLPLNELASWEA